jgi:hypothetical protein
MSFIKGECRIDTTDSKLCAELNENCNNSKTTGRIKNKIQPVALCKIETKALIGNLMVNRFRFFGLFF